MEIAIDFDGTCVTHEFPNVGKDIGAVPILKRLVAKGHKLILYTMRSDRPSKIIAVLKSDYIKARFDGKIKRWWLPSHETEKIDWLKNKFCKENPVTKQPEHYAEIPPMPELSEEHREILRNEFSVPPYNYQLQGIAYNLKNKRVINGEDMGLGKTLETIATVVCARLHKKPILVICKGSGKFMWEREFKNFAGIKAIILTDAIKTTWYQYYTMMGVSVFITNYESVEKFFVERIIKPEGKALNVDNITWKMHPTLNVPMKDLFECVILDESHEIRNETTTKSVLCIGIGHGKPYRFALTGTAVVNNPFDLYQQLNFLGMTKNTKESRKEYIDRYCGGRIGGKPANLKELHYNLSKYCYFRRNKKDVDIQLPELTMSMVFSEIINRKEYQHCSNNLAQYLKDKGKTDGQIEKSMNGEIMVQIQQLMKISSLGRIKETCETIDEVLASGEKIVVGFHHSEVKEEFKKRYRHLFEQKKAFIISGSENAVEKNEAEMAFKNLQGEGVAFVSIKAGGVGLNLQSAWYIICHDLPWHAAIFFQFIARVHRGGQKHHVDAKVMIGKNTIDERIWEIIESKKDIADTITGSDDSDIQRQVINKVRDSLFSK